MARDKKISLLLEGEERFKGEGKCQGCVFRYNIYPILNDYLLFSVWGLSIYLHYFLAE